MFTCCTLRKSVINLTYSEQLQFFSYYVTEISQYTMTLDILGV
jgi:hypothetical protein